jgi:16S rRNA processing protein RimM
VAEGRELVVLGVLGAPHGLRGELRAKLHNPDSDLVRPGLSLTLVLDGARQQREVLALRRSGKGWVLRLAECVDRAQAEALAGSELCVERASLPPLDEDEFYLCDLPGLVVRDPEGRRLGTVEDVIEYPAAQVACVRTPRGLLELPLREPYLLAVEPERGELVVGGLDDLEPVPEKG